ncbi:MAG TPA: phosphatidate cytidylyltransferase [Ideonella sp.]|uniref:phosphatidate cytidylyltransferase n=1 Tax=Ideonella sp. TaxID=1929293 RepID=UPI002E367C7E|nr:phosphatidate cytidylyltransferase [Ideonella sp.]HEX5683381.1 phosphatidate cytidylyltransferase [Ideonella sp.]
MLLQRVITALVLLALLLPALLADSLLPFAALTLLMIGAAGWEWGRLNSMGNTGAVVMGAAVALTCGAAWWAGWGLAAPAAVWWIALIGWVIGGGLALRAGPKAWPQLPQVARLVLGWLMLSVAWLALAAAKQRGLGFILSAMCIVWAADIAAYFGGRTFGRRKLAPSISPGKSWEGVWSGMVGVGLLAWGWMAAEKVWPVAGPSVFSTLLTQRGLVLFALGLVALCGLSVVGDLVESMAKRAAGAKDSSRLLPGHGGVLDRIDALLPVLPAVMALTAV